MGEIKLNRVTVGMLQTNCYIVYDSDIKEATITDPGDNAGFIEECVEKLSVKPVAVFLTHAHGDHIQALSEIRDFYGIPVYVNAADEDMLKTPRLNMSAASVNLKDTDIRLYGGEELSVGGMNIEVLATPGHTPGGTCYYYKDAGFVLSGDTMFCQSWGRTDFAGGDMMALMRSIREKLLPLPEDTIVYPGHDCPTTIKDERRLHGFKL